MMIIFFKYLSELPNDFPRVFLGALGQISRYEIEFLYFSYCFTPIQFSLQFSDIIYKLKLNVKIFALLQQMYNTKANLLTPLNLTCPVKEKK